jgi:hypothetical protein
MRTVTIVSSASMRAKRAEILCLPTLRLWRKAPPIPWLVLNLLVRLWCSILELVRTHFAACGGEEVPPRKFGKAAKPHR